MYQRNESEPLRTPPRIGDVYMIQFDGSGSVQRGFRPGVVFSNNKGNANSPNVIVLPLTTSLKKATQPTHVILDAEKCGLKYTSMVLCENPQSISKDALGKFISHLDDATISRIAVAQLMATSGIAYVDYPTLMSAWESSIRLNAS